MSSTHVAYLTEVALAQYLRSLAPLYDIPSGNIYEGIYHPTVAESKTQTKDTPRIVCGCQSAEYDADRSGNWTASGFVSVVSNADDTTAADHHARVTAVFDVLMNTDVRSYLDSILDGYSVFLVIPKRQEWDIEDRSWVSTMHLDIRCAGTDIN